MEPPDPVAGLRIATSQQAPLGASMLKSNPASLNPEPPMHHLSIAHIYMQIFPPYIYIYMCMIYIYIYIYIYIHIYIYTHA